MLLLLLISDEVGKQFGGLRLDLVVVVLVGGSGEVAIVVREGHGWVGLVIVEAAISSCCVSLLRLLLHHHALENELNLSLNYVFWYGCVANVCCHCGGASHYGLPLAVVFTSIDATCLAIVFVATVVLLLTLIVLIR